MINEHKTISIASQIFEQLEHDILTGKYEKGELLTESRLTAELGVSRTPIREALRRLEQEHIIKDTTKGAVVIGISNEDMRDMYEIRILIEGVAAARAAKNITDDELAEMKEVLDLQNYYIQNSTTGDVQSNADTIKTLDSKFHKMLYRYSASKAYYDTLLPIHRKMIKYRKASISRHSRAEQSIKEHYAIYEALKNHDEKKAQELTTAHIKNARDNIIKSEI